MPKEEDKKLETKGQTKEELDEEFFGEGSKLLDSLYLKCKSVYRKGEKVEKEEIKTELSSNDSYYYLETDVNVFWDNNDFKYASGASIVKSVGDTIKNNIFLSTIIFRYYVFNRHKLGGGANFDLTLSGWKYNPYGKLHPLYIRAMNYYNELKDVLPKYHSKPMRFWNNLKSLFSSESKEEKEEVKEDEKEKKYKTAKSFIVCNPVMIGLLLLNIALVVGLFLQYSHTFALQSNLVSRVLEEQVITNVKQNYLSDRLQELDIKLEKKFEGYNKTSENLHDFVQKINVELTKLLNHVTESLIKFIKDEVTVEKLYYSIPNSIRFTINLVVVLGLIFTFFVVFIYLLSRCDGRKKIE